MIMKSFLKINESQTEKELYQASVFTLAYILIEEI